VTRNGLIGVVDGFQRRHRWAGFPLAVVYKFFDDQGSYLTALVTYYGFLSLFPLLLLLVTILGFALHGDPHLQATLLNSALAQFPVIGTQLRENVRAASGSGFGLVVGVAGTLYGSLGAAQATQNALSRVWAIPRNERPNPFSSRLRSLGLILVLGLGVLATTGLSALTTGASSFGASLAVGVRVAGIVLATLTNMSMFLVAFRVLGARQISLRDLRLAAIVAGLGWQTLQLLGTYLVSHALKGSRESYGVFGLVLGLIAWIYLLALVMVLAAEISVVARRHLWPRALMTPFSDDVRLTTADERSYAAYAKTERHKGFETVDVDFQRPGPDDPGDATGCPPAGRPARRQRSDSQVSDQRGDERARDA
jgi:YihY family inner membrane protein